MKKLLLTLFVVGFVCYSVGVPVTFVTSDGVKFSFDEADQNIQFLLAGTLIKGLFEEAGGYCSGDPVPLCGVSSQTLCDLIGLCNGLITVDMVSADRMLDVAEAFRYLGITDDRVVHACAERIIHEIDEFGETLQLSDRRFHALLTFATAKDTLNDGCRRAIFAQKWQTISFGQRQQVYDVSFSRDGMYCATIADHDGQVIQLWNVQSGQPVLAREIHALHRLGAIDFSYNGELIAAAEENHVVQLWLVNNGELRRTFEPQGTVTNFDVTNIAFSHDDQFIAIGSVSEPGESDGAICVYNIATGERKCLLHVGGYVTSIEFSHGAKFLCVEYGDAAALFESDTGREVVIRDRDSADITDDITAAAFSPDGHHVVLGTTTGAVFLFDLDRRIIERTIALPVPTTDGEDTDAPNLGGFIDHVMFSPNGMLLAITNHQVPAIWLHNFQTGESRCIVTGEDFDEDASTHMWASFSHDSRYVVIHADFHNDRIVRILDTHTNELVGVPQRKVEPDRELCAAFFDPQTRFVVVRDFSHNTRVLRPVLYINSLPEDEEDVTYQLQQLLILRLLQGHGELDLQGSHDLLCIFSSLPAHIQTTLRCENYTS